MSIKQFIYKIKEYLNEQMLMYYIDKTEEILKKYGSLKKWEKSMKKC